MFLILAAAAAAAPLAAPARYLHVVSPNPQAEGWGTLFAPESRKQLAAALKGVDVFKFMINCVTNQFGYCAEADWGQAVEALRELNVSIGIEAGMFSGLQSKELPNSCNGTADALDDLAKVANLLRAGGKPLIWSMDSVFQHTYAYPPEWPGWKYQSPSDCCNFTVEEAAAQGAAYAATLRARLPGVTVGMNEPVAWYTVTTRNGTVYPAMTGHPIDYNTGRDLPAVISALNAALKGRGEAPLAYFHADQPVEYSIGELNVGNAYHKLGALQSEVSEGLGMSFGKYFNSQDGGGISDALFKQRTLLDVRSYAAYNSDRLPEHVIVESWFPLPSTLLPRTADASPSSASFGTGGDSFLETAAAVRKWVNKLPLPPSPSGVTKQQQWAHRNARLAAVQLSQNFTTQPEAQQLALLEGYVAQASADKADLVVFPEYTLGAVHPTLADPKVSRIAAAAAKGSVNVAIGCWGLLPSAQQSGGCPGVGCVEQYTNSILLIDRAGQIIGQYNKTHAATGGGPYYWPPGEGGEWTMLRGDSYPVFDLDFARVGVMTCYDGYFPESARALALQGAELVMWPNGRTGMLEPYLIASTLFYNSVHVIATVIDGQGSGIADFNEGAWKASAQDYAALCRDPGDCYTSATVSMDALRMARKNNRMLHQRRPELAGGVMGSEWDTTGYYDGFQPLHK